MSSAVMPSKSRHTISTKTPLCGLERTKSISVLRRARTDAPRERPAQRLAAAEPGCGRNIFDRQRCGFEQTARVLDAYPFDIARGSATDFGAEDTREIARAHS